MTPVLETIRRILIDEQVLTEAAASGAEDSTALLDTGLMKSVSVIAVVGRLESAFHLRLAPDDIVPENFHSVASMAGLIEKKIATNP